MLFMVIVAANESTSYKQNHNDSCNNINLTKTSQNTKQPGVIKIN